MKKSIKEKILIYLIIQNAYWCLEKMKKYLEMKDANKQVKNLKIAVELYKKTISEIRAIDINVTI